MADGQRRAIVDALGSAPTVCVQAPGRINIIGEHTDYIGGLSLPAAIDRRVMVGLTGTTVETQIHSLDALETAVVEWTRPIIALDDTVQDWTRYMVGAIAVFVEHVAGPDTAPIDVCAPFVAAVTGNVPLGAGLSSSAALTVAWMNALSEWSGQELDDQTIVSLAQQVEHRWLGVACGALDQTASQMGRAGHLLRVDFRTMDVRPVPSAPHVAWLVLHTGVRRGLAHSAYSARVQAVTEGLEQLQIRHADVDHWRDLTLDQVAGIADPLLRRRLRHGVTENARVDEMVAALEQADLPRAGRILDASHESLRSDYEVSSLELDAMAEAARAAPGVYGARMVGAGFGGCVLALANPGLDEPTLSALLERYHHRTGKTGTAHRFQLGPGAGLA